MKVQKSLLVLVIVVLSALLAACSPATAAPETGETVTLIVGPEKVECVGLVAGRECLQVKYSADETEWSWFYDTIQGFTYEPGYVYELSVRKETIANPPADGSSLRWTLIEEVSKTASTEPASPDNSPLVNIPWLLTGFGDGAEVVAGTEVTLTFGEDGSVTGNASINRYNGTYTVTGDALTFSPFASTKMGGDPALMAQETTYLDALSRAVRYEKTGASTVAGATLTLFDSEGTVLLVFTGPRA